MTHPLKRGTFRILQWIFEGNTLTVSLGMLCYVTIWFIPVVHSGADNASDAYIWHVLGWVPDTLWAFVIITAAVYQVLCCRVFRCAQWSRITAVLLVAAFIVYTNIAPLWVIWEQTHTLPASFAGSVVIVLGCLVGVARTLRDDLDGLGADKTPHR